MNCSCLEAAESHVTFDLFLDGVEQSDDLDTDQVPPYEDRLGPDGSVERTETESDFTSDTFRAEGENPDLPAQGPVNMTKSDDDDQYDDDRDEQSKLITSQEYFIEMILLQMTPSPRPGEGARSCPGGLPRKGPGSPPRSTSRRRSSRASS